tara:strand:- start:340 stop:555 length:216 start_codon:yes stop_codon:yes gene_type:complete
MESLDFVYDLVDGMEKQDIQYFVLAIREGKKETKADVFYDLRDEESIRVFETVVGNIDLRNQEEDEDNSEE